MCLNKVVVRSRYRLHSSDNCFPCGTCSACRQSLANSRAQKIANHYQSDSVCYFVTLTYNNDFIPYVSRSEIRQSVKYLNNHPLTDFVPLPIYANAQYVKRFQSYVPEYKKRVIGYLKFNDKLIVSDLNHYKPLKNGKISGILGISTVIKKNTLKYDPDKISIAFTPDAQKFLKRLRKYLHKDFPQYSKISYFYAPEYGPTGHRFHIHFALWFNINISPQQVRALILKAWPFCDKDILTRNIQVARNIASYISSYVNRPTDMPQSLYNLSPLKCSHSLRFGFGKSNFRFEEVVKNYLQSRRVTFDTFKTVLGIPVKQSFLYPKYLCSQFFPKVKGFSRCNRSTLRAFYYNTDYFLSSVGNSRIYAFTPSNEPLYQSLLLDRYGCPILFTVKEANYIRSAIKRYFTRFVNLPFKSCTHFYAFEFLYDFYVTRSSYLYRSMFDGKQLSSLASSACYYNLESAKIYPDLAPTLNESISLLDDKFIYLHNIPDDYDNEKRLIDKFNLHIKQRQFNQFNQFI